MRTQPFDEGIHYFRTSDYSHINIDVLFDGSVKVAVWYDELLEAAEYMKEAALTYSQKIQKEDLPH